MEKNQISFDKNLVYTCVRVSFEEGYAFAKEICENHTDVDGIFVITDLVAVGVLAYLNEHHIKVPDQIAVIFFSNWFMSQVIQPKLSTVDQPSYEMGVSAFNMLLKEIKAVIEEQPKVIENEVLETQIIVRESTSK